MLDERLADDHDQEQQEAEQGLSVEVGIGVRLIGLLAHSRPQAFNG